MPSSRSSPSGLLSRQAVGLDDRAALGTASTATASGRKATAPPPLKRATMRSRSLTAPRCAAAFGTAIYNDENSQDRFLGAVIER